MSFLQNLGLTNSADMVTGMLMLIMICYVRDIMSYKTKAVFSMLFSLVYLPVWFWSGFRRRSSRIRLYSPMRWSAFPSSWFTWGP